MIGVTTWTVHVVAEGNPGIGRCVRRCRTHPEAKRWAETHAMDYRWGLVIVDQRRGLADWGSEWTRADDSEVMVEAPWYARRREARR